MNKHESDLRECRNCDRPFLIDERDPMEICIDCFIVEEGE